MRVENSDRLVCGGICFTPRVIVRFKSVLDPTEPNDLNSASCKIDPFSYTSFSCLIQQQSSGENHDHLH